jgi:transcription elongation factor SPT6
VERAKVPLLRALERCLVNTVCDVGVDINMAVSHNHLAGPLAFVAGLGLRKADALRSNIKSALGFVSSRRELFERKLLGRVVYTNAIGYLRVCDNGISDIQMDPLDDTRIHPECYVQNDFAPKICASALGIEHSAELYIKTVLRLREHCIRELKKNLESNYSFKDAWLTRGELLELPDKMELLELDDYANEVEAAGKGKRFRQFEEIKEELRYPWLDRRVPLPDCPSEYEMFSLITGETDQSVYVGLHVACTVLELKSRSADVMTEVGIRGFVRMQNCSDQHIEDVSEVLQKGACVEGVVVAVIKPQFRVEISFRESDVSKDEAYWFGNRNTHEGMKAWWRECRMSPKAKEQCSSMMYVTIDPYFQEAEALHQYTATYEAKQQKINREHQNEANSGVGGQVKHGNNHRAVFHPLFHNMSSKQAENFLNSGDAEVGDVVIRPSSSDKDTLVVTWMYLPGKFKHIEVSEHNKLEDQGGIGQELRIRGEDEDFTDLDEIFARYIQPMNDLVTNLVGYRCYKEFRPQDQDNGENLGPGVVYMSLEDWLNQEILAAPNRIPYCICLHEKGVPGYFQLSWLRNAGHKVYTEYIAIKPDGYRLRDNFFPTPSELINWFKQNANKAQAAPTRKSRFSSGPPQQSQQSQLPQQTQYSQQTQEFSQQSQFPHEQQYPTPPVQYAVPPPPPQQQYFPPPPPPGSQF